MSVTSSLPRVRVPVLSKAMARKDQVVKQLVGGIEQLLKARKVDLIKATGELVSATEIRTDGAEKRSVQANATIVATGSTVAIPPIKGLAEAKPLDNVGALSLTTAPKRLIVIGGGAIGLELGTFFAELGSEVTVVEMLAQPIAYADPELVRLLVRALGSRGITRGPRIVTDETKAEMKRILGEIQSGRFAKEWILENRAGRPVFNALLRQGETHPIEEVGARLRAMMPWLKQSRLVDKDKN